MFTIFKWFFGIIIVIILVYVIFVLLKTFFGFSVIPSTTSTTTGSDVKESVDAGANTLAYKISHFNLTTWFKDFHPFAYAPISVEPAENSGFYWGGNSESFDERWSGQGYFKNTDSGEESQDLVNGNRSSDKYIQVYLNRNETIKNFQVIKGMADAKVFINNRFNVYVVDNNKNTIGAGYAYTNGDANKNGYIPFRASIIYDEPATGNGYLVFKSQQGEVNAVTVMPIYFKERSYTTNSRRVLPSMIFISPKYDAEYNYNNADYR